MSYGRSTFPESYDSFKELYDLPPSKIKDAQRYQLLRSQESLTPEELNELNQLSIDLQNYIISPESHNHLTDAMTGVQKFFNENVQGFISNKQGEMNTFVDGKKTEINTYTNTKTTEITNLVNQKTVEINETKDSALQSIEQKKENIIDYMDGTTAGKIRNDIGIMGDLSTKDKSSLVNAINEINAKEVDLSPIEQKIENVEDDLARHKADYVKHLRNYENFKNNVDGFRLTDGKLEYYDGSEWQRVRGDGYPVGAVTNFQAKSDNKQAVLTWTDPDDVTIEDSNGNLITIARWKGTKILRKTGSYPANENDGVLVVDNGVRNQYQSNGFVDTGLTNEVTYYYSAFPYTLEDVFDAKTDVSVVPTEQRIYGVRIDKNNSNPETRVTYIGDSIGFTPMRGNNGNFQWGSWQKVFNDYEIKPVVLQNRTVQYYLNPNDFTKKADGSNAVIMGSDGDVMIEFGKPIWYKWADEGDTYTIEISDKEFIGAVKHAFEIEDGYNLSPYYPLLLTQILFVIFFKSTDSQTALGRGYVDGNSGYASTGNANNKGMFFGETTGKQQMKFLGMEDYWGNKFWWIDGLVTDASYNLLIGKRSFNDNGSGYTSHSSGISTNTGGYINSIQGGNDKGFIIKSGSGSETTYYADYGALYSSRVAYFGGYQSYGSDAGFANLRLNSSASSATAYVGARLFCASNGKIYIGAYLGTTVSGKLRSVSGASPSDSKTIGTFRMESKANN